MVLVHMGDLGYIVKFERPVPRVWDQRFGVEQRTWIMTEEKIFEFLVSTERAKARSIPGPPDLLRQGVTT